MLQAVRAARKSCGVQGTPKPELLCWASLWVDHIEDQRQLHLLKNGIAVFVAEQVLQATNLPLPETMESKYKLQASSGLGLIAQGMVYDMPGGTEE